MAVQRRAANTRSRRQAQPAPVPAPPAPAPPARRTHAAYVEDAPDEEFNLDNISSDDEEEESVPPRARARARARAPAPNAPSAIHDDPLLDTVNPTSRSQPSSAADIEYFFKRERDGDTVCMPCR